jgi:hypothetical protein
MKKVLIRSLITAVVFDFIGALINVISYIVTGKYLLATRLNGGEYSGQTGFGLTLNKVIPGDPVSNPTGGHHWISLDIPSLALSLAIGFAIGFIIFFTVYLIGKSVKKHRQAVT